VEFGNAMLASAVCIDDPASDPVEPGQRAEALGRLLRYLKEAGYDFVCPTPATHDRVLRNRGSAAAEGLRDIFGWSLPFRRELLPPSLFACLVAANAVHSETPGLYRSLLRVSSLGNDLLLHSAYPTDAQDAVFFGPDSYRFARFLEHALRPQQQKSDLTIVDVGTGAGAGALVAARLYPQASLVLTDVNHAALDLAKINIKAAGHQADCILGQFLEPVPFRPDIVIANPPYLLDPGQRAYRDGGEMNGAAVAIELARQAVDALAPGGTLCLYSGSAIVRGKDCLKDVLAQLARNAGARLEYAEIDPDVFGEELETPRYRNVDRIAAVGAVMTR
jgi:SAM-dependent methyltransferase